MIAVGASIETPFPLLLFPLPLVALGLTVAVQDCVVELIAVVVALADAVAEAVADPDAVELAVAVTVVVAVATADGFGIVPRIA